jgi:peptide deformylase
MKLVDENDPILKQPSEKFNFLNPQVDLQELIEGMTKIMRDNGGIGLSACQVGIPVQVFIMESETPIIIINPKILEYSEETTDFNEGCLSFPGDYIKMRRPKWVVARFIAADGKGITTKFEGIASIVFQHEYDHLLGKTMFDYMSKLKLEIYKKKKEKRNKNAINNRR